MASPVKRGHPVARATTFCYGIPLAFSQRGIYMVVPEPLRLEMIARGTGGTRRRDRSAAPFAD
jgi:hypothetical protein